MNVTARSPGLRAVVLSLAFAGCSSAAPEAPAPSGGEADPCAGAAGPCTAFDANRDDETAIQEALITASPGHRFVFGAGTFAFRNTLIVGQPDVTLRGAGRDRTVLDFKGQESGSEGIFATADGFTAEDLTVQETVGDGIKVKGAQRAIFRRLRVSWRSDTPENHGAYGLYPVQCAGVLVEDSEVEGASDAGIYVGQSKTIVVRRNRVFGNVAGIEVENSFDADVYGNTAEGNTAGILVFDLPDLEQKNGARVRVFDNTVRGNNFRNFGKPGTTLAQLPAGTGIVVLASTDVEITGNAVEENDTMSVVVGSYLLLQRPYADTSFYPFSRRVAVRDNRITAGGGKPDTTVDFGKLLEAGRPSFAGQKVPAVVYDGIVDGRESFAPGNPMGLCLGEAERGSFARLEDIPQNRWSSAAAPYACTLPPLPPVSLSFAP